MTTLNPIPTYIKSRGEHNLGHVRAHYETPIGAYELDVHVNEWELERGWEYRVVQCNATGPTRDYHHEEAFLTGVPWFSSNIWQTGHNDTVREFEPTRAEQIQYVTRFVKRMIDGAEPTDVETEQAVNEVLDPGGDDDDFEMWLIV